MQQRGRMFLPCSASAGSRVWLSLLMVGLALLQSACILKDRLNPELEVPQSYTTAHVTSQTAVPPIDWWRQFRSAELTDLMEQAQAANFDIAAAVARIVEADANARIAGAALLPSINGSYTEDSTKTPSTLTGGPPQTRTLYTAALNASYTFDFWGHNRALVRAADLVAAATRFDREVVALSTLVTVADTYFLVLEGQDRLRVNRENLAAAERILKLIQDRFKFGTAAALDVAQQASLVAIQRAAIPPLVEQIEQNKATLALLIGRAPEMISIRGGSMWRLGMPRVSPGLPSELLTQRPDIREAELRLASADANVYAARTAFFPTIALTATGGFESLALKTLFTPGATFYDITKSITQPIFEGGLLLGQLDLQKGTREELLQDYRKSVISAFTDVERALVAVQQTTLQEKLQRESVAESRRAFELSEQRLRAGTIDLTTLSQIEQTLFQQEDLLAQVRFSRLQAYVALYQALGGGWFLDKEPLELRAMAPDVTP